MMLSMRFLLLLPTESKQLLSMIRGMKSIIKSTRGLLLLVAASAVLLTLANSCSEVRHMSAEVAYRTEAQLGEGAIWHPDRGSLFWVDIEKRTLYEFMPEKKKCRSWQFDRKVTTVVPETDHTVIVALENSIVRFDLNTQQKQEITPVDTKGGRLRCNDGKCSPNGWLWVGTMSIDEKSNDATLYCVRPSGRIDAMIRGVTISNGIVWSRNNKYIYYNDTPTGKIRRYRYHQHSGDIIKNGIAVDISEGTGLPDGMTIDRNDNLWVAQWGGFGVYCYNAYTGELIAKVEVPAPNVTSCAFGGKNMDILYITTAREGLTPDELAAYPLSGCIFSCKPGAIGVSPNYFGQENK